MSDLAWNNPPTYCPHRDNAEGVKLRIAYNALYSKSEFIKKSITIKERDKAIQEVLESDDVKHCRIRLRSQGIIHAQLNHLTVNLLEPKGLDLTSDEIQEMKAVASQWDKICREHNKGNTDSPERAVNNPPAYKHPTTKEEAVKFLTCEIVYGGSTQVVSDTHVSGLTLDDFRYLEESVTVERFQEILEEVASDTEPEWSEVFTRLNDFDDVGHYVSYNTSVEAPSTQLMGFVSSGFEKWRDSKSEASRRVCEDFIDEAGLRKPIIE
mgnify:CR=1 FL=1|jgi:hypothetical protein